MESKKAGHTGIGWVDETLSKAEDLAEELVERGQLKRKDSRGFIKTLIDRAQGEQSEFWTVARDILQDIFESLGVATRTEFDTMAVRLDRLEARIDAVLRKPAARKAPRKPAAKRKTRKKRS